MSKRWPYPGARWWKFDFHTHTPASTDTPWHRLSPPNELTPEQWLLKYMAAEIDCVAVTDHNSGAWIDLLKTAYAAMQLDKPAGFRELRLFPGVELSVHGGFHLLAVFDTSTATSDIDELRGAVGYDGTPGDSDGVTRKGAAEVVQAVLDAGGIPILAHVDDPKGLLRLEAGSQTKAAMDANTLRQVLEIPGILAMEVVEKTTPKPAIYTQSGKRWTEVLGSDCHNFKTGYANLPGSRYTWVKMAHPSLEGLRLALLDGEGVSVLRSDEAEGFDPFATPEHFIESIEIREAWAMGRGRPAILNFNPCFNALIGGRGTGKSTVVHALRLAYRREGDLERFGEKSEPRETFDRFNHVFNSRNQEGGLLAETGFILTLCRDRVRHRLHWPQDGQGVMVEESHNGQLQASSSQTITPQRFPVRIFSQGQIAAMAGDNQQTLLEVIDEAAGTAKQKAEQKEAQSVFFALRAKRRELDGKLQGRDVLNVSLQDAQRKLQRFEEAHHAEILKTYQNTQRQGREAGQQLAHAAGLAERLRTLAAELLAEDLPEGLFDEQRDADALAPLRRLSQAIARAKSQVEAAANVLTQAGDTAKADLLQIPWQQRVERAKAAYETLKSDLQAQGVNDPSEYGYLVQERQRLETQSKQLDALQKQREEVNQQIKEQLQRVREARRAVSDARRAFLRGNLAQNPFVRITLLPFGRDPRLVERTLREVLGAGDKYGDDIYIAPQDDSLSKGLVADLLAGLPDDPETATSEMEQRLLQVQKRLLQACQGRGDFGAWFNKFLAGETEKRPEFADHILCWFPEDGLRVEYTRKGDGQDFQPIGQASAGQRAAAMLAFLLAHGNEPLVLDQPEDDLDNHLIYNLVVQQIRANKQRRQLIVVTHNPNIVVNGDAELVHALDFNGQCYVKQSGSLQDEAMRKEVCDIMEGGREAFERRYRRLGRKV
ncbi:MAG TPA: AAA family ATPase [Methylococcaceae bacterium]|nr:AAA family ATPase [Methylococcaceae bacterium]